ncbi:hypothetical protein FIBSPDRAFT_877407 [Athelia psychrophila]|uniref:Uncharacterized protein n=1 Tax=Athelia psychrophila TaxID=1759441 RepID=A0A167W0Y7_9AGAM|nr:hypothetical protein FIBSPDRAFT_877407 [Fibularhizoctonia sp. CBS 109695]
MGVITLEDIIEEIISEEIVEETDWYEDNTSKKRAKWMTTAAVMRGIVERGRAGEMSRDRTPLLPAVALPTSPKMTPRATANSALLSGGNGGNGNGGNGNGGKGFSYGSVTSQILE